MEGFADPVRIQTGTQGSNTKSFPLLPFLCFVCVVVGLGCFVLFFFPYAHCSNPCHNLFYMRIYKDFNSVFVWTTTQQAP